MFKILAELIDQNDLLLPTLKEVLEVKNNKIL